LLLLEELRVERRVVPFLAEDERSLAAEDVLAGDSWVAAAGSAALEGV
jgi:hypothetical protein